MGIRKIQILLPIVCRDIVLTGADVVVDGVADRMVDRRHFIGAHAGEAK